MRKRGRWGFAFTLIALLLTIGLVGFSENLSDLAVDRFRLFVYIATLILIPAACVAMAPIAKSGHDGGQVAAIFAFISAAFTFVAFALELMFFGQRGALIGPALMIVVGLPSLVVSSMFAWLLSKDETPSG